MEKGTQVKAAWQIRKYCCHYCNNWVGWWNIFLSSNITGNAIAGMTIKTTSFLGAGLLIIGLVAGFFWLKSKKK